MEPSCERGEVFILEQEFLINQAGDVCQQASPFVVWHEEHPSLTQPSGDNLTTVLAEACCAIGSSIEADAAR